MSNCVMYVTDNHGKPGYVPCIKRDNSLLYLFKPSPIILYTTNNLFINPDAQAVNYICYSDTIDGEDVKRIEYIRKHPELTMLQAFPLRTYKFKIIAKLVALIKARSLN